MNKKEDKKGFWASLFAPKSNSCSCGSVIEKVKEEIPQQEDANKEKEKNESKSAPTCSGGG